MSDVKSILDLDIDDDDVINCESSKPWTEGANPDYQFIQNLDTFDDDPEQKQLTTAGELVKTLLSNKGITDPSLIKIENENGEIDTVDFDSLDLEDRIAILSDQNSSTDLDDDEIDIINTWRSNNLSAEDYIKYVKEEAVREYLAQNTETEYEINSLTNEELYFLDLQDKYPNLSEDELVEALEHDKGNERLFEKKVAELREYYLKQEKDFYTQKEQEKALELEEQLTKQKEQIMNSAANIAYIGEFELDDNDREEVSNFLLGQDSLGLNHFAKALKEPDTLFKMAWFALKGDTAFEDLSSYYKDQIAKVSRASYQKGLDDQKNGKTLPSSKVVVKTSGSTTKGSKSPGTLSINDLD